MMFCRVQMFLGRLVALKGMTIPCHLGISSLWLCLSSLTWQLEGARAAATEALVLLPIGTSACSGSAAHKGPASLSFWGGRT